MFSGEEIQPDQPSGTLHSESGFRIREGELTEGSGRKDGKRAGGMLVGRKCSFGREEHKLVSDRR